MQATAPFLSEEKLVEKLRLIEALFAGATTAGERDAADHARQRILNRLRSIEVADPPIEYKFTMADMWSRRLFVSLLRRYNLRPYRYSRQRYTTVMARVSERFVKETLWPQFQELDETLRSYLSNVTNRVISQVINQDMSEADVVSEPAQLVQDTREREPTKKSSGNGAGKETQEAQSTPREKEQPTTAPERPAKNKRKHRRKKRRGR